MEVVPARAGHPDPPIAGCGVSRQWSPQLGLATQGPATVDRLPEELVISESLDTRTSESPGDARLIDEDLPQLALSHRPPIGFAARPRRPRIDRDARSALVAASTVLLRLRMLERALGQPSSRELLPGSADAPSETAVDAACGAAGTSAASEVSRCAAGGRGPGGAVRGSDGSRATPTGGPTRGWVPRVRRGGRRCR